MRKNNDVTIKRFILKLSINKSSCNEELLKNFNSYIKKNLKTILKNNLKIPDKYKFCNIDIDQIQFNIDDVVKDGKFFEPGIIETINKRIQDYITYNFNINNEEIKFYEQYRAIVVYLEEIRKNGGISNGEQKDLLKNYGELLDKKPEAIIEICNTFLPDEDFTKDFFNILSEDLLLQTVNILRKDDNANLQKIYNLYNKKHINENPDSCINIGHDKRSLDYVLEEKLLLDNKQKSIVKEALAKSDLEYILRYELKLTEEQIHFVKEFLSKQKKQSITTKRRSEKKSALARTEGESLDNVLRDKLALTDEEIKIVKSALARTEGESLDNVLRDKLALTDEQIEIVKSALARTEGESLDNVLRDKLALTDEEIEEIKTSLKRIRETNLNNVLRDKLVLTDEQIDFVNFSLAQTDDEYIDTILKNEFKLTDEQINIVKVVIEKGKIINSSNFLQKKEILKNNLNDFENFLKQEIYLDDEYIKLVKECIAKPDYEKVLKEQLKQTDVKVEQVKIALANGNLDYVLTENLHLNDQQIRQVKKSLASPSLFYVLQNIIHLNSDKISLIKSHLGGSNLEYILRNEIHLSDEQIELIKTYIVNTKLDYILKNQIQLDDIQVSTVVEKYEGDLQVVQKELETLTSQIGIPFSLENIDISIESLDNVIKNQLNLNGEQISFIQAASSNQKLETILKYQLKLSDKQIELVKAYISQTDIVFESNDIQDVLKEKLNLQDDQIRLIKASTSKVNLEYIFKHDLKLNDDQIEMILQADFDKEQYFKEQQQKQIVLNKIQQKESLIRFQKLSLSTKISKEFVNTAFRDVIIYEADRSFLTTILKSIKNLKEVFNKVEQNTAQSFILYLTESNFKTYESFIDIVRKLEKKYTIKQLNFDILEKFLDTKEIEKVMFFVLTKVAKKNNIKYNDLIKIVQNANNELINIFPIKNSEEKTKIIENKFKFQPRIIEVLKKHFGINEIIWNFDLSFKENILSIIKSNDLPFFEYFLPLINLENIISSYTYLHFISADKEDFELLDKILYDSLIGKNVDIEQRNKLEKKYLHKEEIKLLDQYYVKNGGLVIMFPFIQYAFHTLGYINEKNNFKSTICQNNAMHFIQYLLTNEYKNDIMRMPLNKLFCGINLKDPIYEEFIFDEDEDKKEQQKKLIQETSQKVFNEIINRWKNLFLKLREYDEYDLNKGISDVQLLREYIFTRDAVINEYGLEEEGEKDVQYYTMKITTKEYDDEIKNLPWSCNEILLPYMNYKLYVEYFGGMFYDEKNK